MEELKYKVVLDAEDVPVYLDNLKQQINSVLESSGGGFNQPSFGGSSFDARFAAPQVQSIQSDLSIPTMAIDPSVNNFYNAPQFMPTTTDPISMTIPTMDQAENLFERASNVIQSGYYKATSGLQSIRSTAALAKYNLTSGFNRELTPINQMSPLQLGINNLLGIGYDPLESTLSRKEWENEGSQRFADNSSLGMMDWSFSDMVIDPAITAGSTAMMIPGVGWVGGGIAAATAGTAGALTYVANEVAKPFRQEDLFRRNITRGLRNYSRYTTGGYMDFEDRYKVADFVANRDLSPELVGQKIGRDDIEGMFNQLMDTQYFQQSINADDMVSKIKTFTKDFTDVMHIFRVSKEEVGKVVDQMNNSGLLDVFNGNIGAASRYLEAAGISTRLDPNQALQVYQTGAEMVRGTGIAMGAGGDLLVDTLADIKNLLQSQNISRETINQMGGDMQAALSLANYNYQQASSPGGFLLANAMQNGQYNPSSPLGMNYLSGLSGITSFESYIKALNDQESFLSQDGNIQLVGMSKTLGLLQNIQRTGLLGEDMTSDEAARYLSISQGISMPQARLQVESLLNAGDSANKQLTERLNTIAKRVYQDKPSWLEETSDRVSNFFTKFYRDNFQYRGDINTEIDMEVQDFSNYNIIGQNMSERLFENLPDDFKITPTNTTAFRTELGQESWDTIYGALSKSRGGNWYGTKQKDVDNSKWNLDPNKYTPIGVLTNLVPNITDPFNYLTDSIFGKKILPDIENPLRFLSRNVTNTVVNEGLNYFAPRQDISPEVAEDFVESEFNFTLTGADTDNFFADLISDFKGTKKSELMNAIQYTGDILSTSQSPEDYDYIKKKYNITDKEIEETSKKIDTGNLNETLYAMSKKDQEYKNLPKDKQDEKSRQLNRLAVISLTRKEISKEGMDVSLLKTNNLGEAINARLDKEMKNYSSVSWANQWGLVGDRVADILEEFDHSGSDDFLGLSDTLDYKDVTAFLSMSKEQRRKKILSEGGTEKEVQMIEDAVKNMRAAELISLDVLKPYMGSTEASGKYLKDFLESKNMSNADVDINSPKSLYTFFETHKELRGELNKYLDKNAKEDVSYLRVVSDFSNPTTRAKYGIFTGEDYLIERDQITALRENAEKMLDLSTRAKTIMNSDGSITQTTELGDPTNVLPAMNVNMSKLVVASDRSNQLQSMTLRVLADKFRTSLSDFGPVGALPEALLTNKT